jgi:SagB-type dehydrogenase family enzyme
MTDERKTNPFVSVLPLLADDDPRFVVRDVRRNTDYEIPNPTLLELLAEAADGIKRGKLRGVAVETYGLSADLAESVIEMLEEKSLLIPADGERGDLEREREQWRDAGWGEAFDFYACIRDYPFYEDNDPDSVMERVAERVERNEEVPPVYKCYEDAPRTGLPEVDESEPLASTRAVLGASDPISDADETVDVELLSKLLFYAFGEVGRQSLEGVGEFPLKTSPSAGGRHPTEAYVATFDVDGVEEGFFHYSVEDHDLERVASGTAALEALESSRTEDAAFAVVLTSVVERQMWKYRDPRTFRLPHHDAGHLMETLRLLGRATALPVTFDHELDRTVLAEHLRIDRLEELILWCGFVG